MRTEAHVAYLHDPAFRIMVDAIHCVLRESQLTPSEVRAAAVYACVRYEEHRASQPFFVPRPPVGENT